MVVRALVSSRCGDLRPCVVRGSMHSAEVENWDDDLVSLGGCMDAATAMAMHRPPVNLGNGVCGDRCGGGKNVEGRDSNYVDNGDSWYHYAPI